MSEHPPPGGRPQAFSHLDAEQGEISVQHDAPEPDGEPEEPAEHDAKAAAAKASLPTPRARLTRSRIMYIEYKGGLTGPARIGRITYSKTGNTVYYAGRRLESQKGSGYKTSHFDVETGETYWISGPRKDGQDTLYPGVVAVDEDVRVEYWTRIRELPENVHLTEFRSEGKHSKRRPHPGSRLTRR